MRYYGSDRHHQRFVNNEQGFPLLKDEPSERDFLITYGQGNGNVREYMLAVSRYSYLLAHTYLPADCEPARLDRASLQLPFGEGMTFRQMSLVALSDAVDAVARIWLRDLRRYMKWDASIN